MKIKSGNWATQSDAEGKPWSLLASCLTFHPFFSLLDRVSILSLSRLCLLFIFYLTQTFWVPEFIDEQNPCSHGAWSQFRTKEGTVSWPWFLRPGTQGLYLSRAEWRLLFSHRLRNSGPLQPCSFYPGHTLQGRDIVRKLF